jgi:hypothetical protein
MRGMLLAWIVLGLFVGIAAEAPVALADTPWCHEYDSACMEVCLASLANETGCCVYEWHPPCKY